MTMDLSRRTALEFLGTMLLLATVVGSGIMADRLSGGNIGLALLANSISTGAMLFVLISMIGPLSGAHFNPVVSLAMVLTRDLKPKDAFFYFLAQLGGAIVGVVLAHAMFDLDLIQASVKIRAGTGQNVAEWVATFGLLLTIFMTRAMRPEQVPASVALYITAAYWFTASTSFANPAVTVARSLTNTFAGIESSSVPAFIVFQVVGALSALLFVAWLGLITIPLRTAAPKS